MRVETGYETKDSFRNTGVLQLKSPDRRELVINTKDSCEMELVGRKAFNISRLAREGFAVPEGFCITTEAYDYFMDFNSILEKGEETCDEIKKGFMPPLLAELICDAYHEYLYSKPCVVRSSSPVEDLKQASSAGQYKSFLNVEEDTLLDAVKECWASLWGRKATEYRKNKKIKNKNIEMAVLVQEMLPATVSGVLFTEEKIIIEAVWGLGDLLVGGKAIPDHFEVDRETLEVVERRISHKYRRSQANPSGGLEITDVPEHLQDAPVLKDDYIQELCTLSTQVETLFGCPQDIEWALCKNELILLQARPISAGQTPTVYSRANLAETQPGYVTYLSRIPENRPDFFVVGVTPLLDCFGIKDIPENLKLTEYIYGHIYVNMSAVHNTLGRISGLSPELLNQSMGHQDDEEEAPKVKLGFSEIVKLLPGALRLMKFFLQLPAQGEKVVPHSMELIEDIRHRKLDELSLEELDELVWEMYDRTAQVFQIHACTALVGVPMNGIIQKTLKRIGEEDNENLLYVGLEGMSSCQLGLEIWNLAQKASVSTRVSELILSRGENVLEELKQIPDGVQFLEELKVFTEKFGDRCSQELELSVPRWGENPQFILAMVANCLSSEANPVKTVEEQRRQRFRFTDRVLRKLSKNPIERLIFEKILGKFQQNTVMRENLKTAWVRGVSAMRALYLAIAEKLVDTGVLQNREDIFYLKMTEVSNLTEGSLKGELLRGLIEERKREREECEQLEVPMMIVGKPPPIGELKYTVEPEDKLEGLGCSYGVVTGRAIVVSDPSECLEIEEGEILIAPVTDPGWAPLFVTAGGLVMELGAALSHGVIIAREYGIPAVVGVKNATKIIKTGQTVTVDGNNGVVYIRE